jgi:hypothetical protein
MDEPHDIPNIDTWASTVQAAVTAIRNAGVRKTIDPPPWKWLDFCSNVRAEWLWSSAAESEKSGRHNE